MILINVKYKVKPEFKDNFRELVADFTNATLAEDGNLFFEWFRSTDEDDVYICLLYTSDAADE